MNQTNGGNTQFHGRSWKHMLTYTIGGSTSNARYMQNGDDGDNSSFAFSHVLFWFHDIGTAAITYQTMHATDGSGNYYGYSGSYMVSLGGNTMIIDRATYINNLYSDVVNVTKNLETNTYKAFDKDNKEITLDMNAVEAEFAKLDYKNKRMKEYPSLRDLADAMYWNSKGDSSKLYSILRSM